MLSAELALYVFVYNNFHLVALPWDSPATWYLCFIGVDFLYYWFHRAAHGKQLAVLPTYKFSSLIKLHQPCAQHLLIFPSPIAREREREGTGRPWG